MYVARLNVVRQAEVRIRSALRRRVSDKTPQTAPDPWGADGT